MGKPYFLLLLFVLVCGPASAQFASSGESENFDRVFWLTWSGDLTEKEYIWHFSPEVRIVAQVANINRYNTRYDDDWGGNPTISPYTPGGYSGDGLGWMYSGTPSTSITGVTNSGLVTMNGETVRFDIDLQLEFLVGGVWKDISYPGMVIADAEELNGTGEYISAEIKNSTAGSTFWQLIDKRTASKDAAKFYKLTFDNDFQKFTIKPEGGKGNQAVLFARGATGLENVEMKGGGKTALALGFVLPFDVSEAEGYCEARHYIDDFKDVDIEFDSDTDLSQLEVTELNNLPTLYIGSSDDPLDHGSLDTIELQLNFTQDIIKVSVPVTNNTEESATLYWWMDFNNDGVFADNEVKIFPDIAVGETSLDVPLEFTEADFPTDYVGENLRVGDLHSRFRITTTALVNNPDTEQDERSCGLAIDGEVEDYTFTVQGINISGSVFVDADGMEDGLIDNSFSSGGTESIIDFSIGFPQPLYAYLLASEKDSIVGKAIVDKENGTYEITNMNHGSYDLSLSVLDLTVGTFFSEEADHLPTAWAPVGESLGTDNAYTPEGGSEQVLDMRIPIETPNAGMDISGVDFGVDQPPFPKNDAVDSPAYKSVEVAVLDNDSDLQGDETMLPTSVVLLPSEATAGEELKELTTDAGTFTVLADGRIRFVPFNFFHGKTARIAYAVRDAAGLLSEPALLEIMVERPRMVISNPMMPSRAQKTK